MSRGNQVIASGTSNPLALVPQQGQPSPAEQMAGLVAYLDELGTDYPELAATADYEAAMALSQELAAALESLDLTQADELLARFQQDLPPLSVAFAGLATTAAQTLPQAVFVPQLSLPGATARG